MLHPNVQRAHHNTASYLSHAFNQRPIKPNIARAVFSQSGLDDVKSADEQQSLDFDIWPA